MISIIICSRKNAVSEYLSTNIEKTVGCEYELIVIDNSENKYSIFEAYNIGIEKSIGNLLCFIHDDILFHTKNWGDVVTHIFNEDKKVGLLGIAGSKIKTKMPSAWWDCPEELKVINIIQHFKEPEREKERWYKGFNTDSEVEVVAVDGVFMAIRKDRGICFNSKLHGFHNYDLNIAIEYYKKGYKTFVTNRVLIEHFSIGIINKVWYNSTLDFQKIYAVDLPLKIDAQILEGKVRKQEFINGINFINGLLNYNLKKQAFYYWILLIKLKPSFKFHLNFLKSIKI